MEGFLLPVVHLSHFPGHDGAEHEVHRIQHRLPGAEDMAVLMRSPGPRLRHYLRAMAEAGIPCAVQESEDFFASMEVAVLYSCLLYTSRCV